MKGLPRRIRFRRPPSDPAPQDTQATAVASADPAAATPAERLPAGLAPEDVAPNQPSFRDRGRLRRRMRYLRSVREIGFRDLGGLVFDLHRFARRNDELVLRKLASLDAVDRELRAIERVLDERRDLIELREPGVAACPRCGALHGSDARFCPQCGTQLSGPLAMGAAIGGVAGDAPADDRSPIPAPLATPPPPAPPASPPQPPPGQPTQAMPAVAADGEHGAGDGAGDASPEAAVTGGDPPARGERPES